MCGAYLGAHSVKIAYIYIYIYVRRTSRRTTWGRCNFWNWCLFRSFEKHEKQDLRKKVRRIGGAYPEIETERAGCPKPVMFRMCSSEIPVFDCLYSLNA